MLDNFNFDGEGVYYIFFADFPDYCLSIENNNLKLNVSLFQDSFYQSFYIFENEDNSYYIMNLNSLKILGVNFNLTVTQNDIKPLKQNKWEITKNGYFNNYYIDNRFWNKRLDCNNEYFIINEKNDYSKTQKFLFKKCIYNITKSDIWNKWEIHLLREFTDNQLYIISSADNENNVLTLNSYNNNITLNSFTGNKEQIFFILNKDYNYYIFSYDKGFVGVNNTYNGIILNKNNNPVKYQINKSFPQYNDYPLYNISFQDNYYNNYNLDITLWL